MKKLKFPKFKNAQAGMTYIELIVVLSIFSIMSAVIIFNYTKFQAKVDIKNLANDIALKIVEAQKSSIAGKLPPLAEQAIVPLNWKPAYGVYMNTMSPGSNKNFIYFADLDQSGDFTDTTSFCSNYSTSGDECLDKINITKGNYISSIELSGGGCSATISNLGIAFKRPSAEAVFSSNPALGCTPTFVVININSPQNLSAKVKLWASGRLEIQ